MIATGLTNDRKFVQCKNSYRNDPTKIDDKDIEIVNIPLNRSDASSEWTLFVETEAEEAYIDAFYIKIELKD